MSIKRRIDNKLLQELEENKTNKNYYDALQIYRTLFSRFIFQLLYLDFVQKRIILMLKNI